MGKRGAAAPSTPAKRASKGGEGSSSASEPVIAANSPEVKALIGGTSYVARLTDYFDKVVAEHGSLVAYLNNKYSTVDLRLSFALELDEAFPPEVGVKYAMNGQLAAGQASATLFLRPWMLGWRADLGNKGLLIVEDCRALFQLVALRGFCTDPLIPGTELLVVNEVNPVLVESPYEAPALQEGLVGCGAVAYTKGWTRAVVAVGVMDGIIALDMVEEVKQQGAANKVWEKFRTMHAIVGEYKSEAERVLGNRGGSHRPLKLEFAAERKGFQQLRRGCVSHELPARHHSRQHFDAATAERLPLPSPDPTA